MGGAVVGQVWVAARELCSDISARNPGILERKKEKKDEGNSFSDPSKRELK